MTRRYEVHPRQTGTGRMWTRRRAVPAAIVTIVLTVLAACGGGDQDARAESSAAPTVVTLSPADVAVAVREDVGSGVVVTGPLNPYREVEVRAQVPGVLLGLRVDRGDAVAAGQPIVRIEAEGVRGQATSARAGVAAAEAQVALARRQLESARKLHEAGALSDIELEEAEAGFRAAEAQLAAARAQAAGAGESAARATVTAPIAGEISARHASEGEAVNPGQAIVTIVNTRVLELAGQVPVDRAVGIRRGMPVEFTVDAYPGRTLRGEVARVEPTADPGTRQVGVYVRLPNQDRELVGGLYAAGRILTGESREAVVVPIDALRSDEGGTHVWVIEGGAAVRAPVTVGIRDERRGVVQILSGLEGGERVIAAPGEIRAGAAVRVAETATEAEGGR